MQTSSETDAALVDATRRRDHAAFARIIERYQRPVYAVAFSRIRDRALADDLTQDTFVLAWRRLDELRDATRLPAWLCGIARNLARDARKRQRREHAGGLRERLERAAGGRGDRASDVVDLATSTPFEALDDAQCDRIVAAALAEVPETYREPLVLYYFEEQSIDDVARALGISAETTHRRLSRGRRFLAERTHELVEHRMPRRGPSPALVAGVLAVIGSLAAGSHVEASPPKGFAMSKLVIVTVLVASLGTVGLIAAGPRTPPRNSAANATATTPPVVAKVPVKAASRASAPVTTVSPASAASSSRPAPALPVAAAVVVPDCAAVGKHMAALSMAQISSKPLPAPKRALFENQVVERTVRHCRDESWSENMRLCIVDADDYKRATNDCTDEVGATAAELVDLPVELSCRVLAQHVYDVASAPDAKFGIIKQNLASSPDKLADLDRLIAKARDQLAIECDERPWTVAKRRCIAASKTQEDYGNCR